jgi:hypothetical protein
MARHYLYFAIVTHHITPLDAMQARRQRSPPPTS